MFTSEQYRAKASEYAKLAGIANGPNEVREFQRLERSFTQLTRGQCAVGYRQSWQDGACRRGCDGTGHARPPRTKHVAAVTRRQRMDRFHIAAHFNLRGTIRLAYARSVRSPF
jgi:hypothetical protein